MAAADQKPYVGPRPFGRDEKDIFFGRDSEARDLCSLVVAPPLVLLHAASGAGKSSLLNAVLIPMLRVVLVMRRECVGQLETHAPLLPEDLRITPFALDQLEPEAAQEAIEGPLARTDRKIAPEASQRLVEELRTITVRGVGGENVETVVPAIGPGGREGAVRNVWAGFARRGPPI